MILLSKYLLKKIIIVSFCSVLTVTFSKEHITEQLSPKKLDSVEELFGTSDLIEHDGNSTSNNLFDSKKDDRTEHVKTMVEKLPDRTKEDRAEEHEEEITPETKEESEEEPKQPVVAKPRRIKEIIVSGNIYTSTDAILNYVPYKVGEVFDPRKSRQVIHNLYFGLKRFRNITIKGENVSDDFINIHIIVEEKKPLKDVHILGNKHVSDKEINKKINFDEIKAIDGEELKKLAHQIKQVYLDKGYHMVDIETELQIDEDDRAIAIFTIHEGKQSLVKQIHFIGNKHVSSKELRRIVVTKEDWLLSFLDKAGQYHPGRIEADKHFIEQFYQNRGFLHAKVINVDVAIDEKTRNITITYEVEEGDQYTISEVHAPSNELVSEEYLRAILPVRVGMIYSRDTIAQSIKQLERIWGDHGYIFAHIEPSIQPDEDTKTVALSFFSELGEKVYLNRLNIRGNKKTRDKIIRRKIILEEGELITQSYMNASKRNVESLGYFNPRDGVNWRMRRLTSKEADLDLIVKETKTGHFGAQIGFGGAGVDLRSPSSGFSVKGELSDTNLLGSGINFNFSATWSKDEQTVLFHIAQPWLFDKPILGAFDIYHKRPTYDELFNLDINAVHEKLTGGALTAGFITQSKQSILHDVRILLSVGIDDIRYQRRPQAQIFGADEQTQQQYQGILDKEFEPGKFVWLSTKLEQDTRNHPIHTSRGHKWKLSSKFAIPTFGNNIGYYKLGLDANWYTPLIGEYDLVLHLHSYFGIAAPFKNRVVPFGELFHIGGQHSVRGFLFGQIGPKFQGDTIGAKKALFWNVELIFPITGDMTMKGALFYDGGAGFDNPYVSNVSRANLTGNNFDYRHSVGIGLRLLKPMPIKIDWGFKIDPRKNKLDPEKSETGHEIHFGMTYDW